MWNSPSNPGTDNDINIEVQMAEAIATEGGDVDAEETDEADLVAIEVKGSIKTDEVKGNIFLTIYVLVRPGRIIWRKEISEK